MQKLYKTIKTIIIIMDFSNSVKKRRTILRLFPYLKNIDDVSKLLIDENSIHYISSREYAEKITEIIQSRLNAINISNNEAIITDATAGVGGDTISFSKNFKHVNAIEIDSNRAIYLENNIGIYGCDNVTVINDNCDNILHLIDNHNIIFVDPPWEPNNSGSYKQYENLKLPFCNISLETFCNKLMDISYMKRVPELIVIKLPKNYDIIYFFQNINNKQVYYYDLGKMLILVIVNSIV